MALVELEKAGILKLVIRQNGDDLHLRSRIQREKLAELYFRDSEAETSELKETSRYCSYDKRQKVLKDAVLNWEPSSDVFLLCSTVKSFWFLCGSCYTVVFLIRSFASSSVMLLQALVAVRSEIGEVMNLLSLQNPPFARIDILQIILKWLHKFSPYISLMSFHIVPSVESQIKDIRVNWTLQVASASGQKDELPLIKSAEIHLQCAVTIDATARDFEKVDCSGSDTVKEDEFKVGDESYESFHPPEAEGPRFSYSRV
ncbi:NAD-dependent protein deacetylase SRT1-like [Neltuma alba]|uniref:NAD-dependent protein deacetylase SRT1-like n=1 Tax=Neltuma alba TaxID=207710 RepID=UPI0010A31367|nr:NAD-dependent protein deacetylase SRT1-like [Prosopis alba]